MNFIFRTCNLYVAVAVLFCIFCGVCTSQLPTTRAQPTPFSGLLPDGDARLFVAAFKESACIQDLKRITIGSVQIKYFVCPKTLTLVRVNLAFSLDKSRYTFLLQAVKDAEPTVDFHEVSGESLKQCGIDPEAIFLVLFPPSVSIGMGATIGPIVDIRIQEKQMHSFRVGLLEVLKEENRVRSRKPD